jgi:hypothetical protein
MKSLVFTLLSVCISASAFASAGDFCDEVWSEQQPVMMEFEKDAGTNHGYGHSYNHDLSRIGSIEVDPMDYSKVQNETFWTRTFPGGYYLLDKNCTPVLAAVYAGYYYNIVPATKSEINKVIEAAKADMKKANRY